MKYLKMLGLVVVGAVGLASFVGASSASAAVLCTKEEDPCAAGARVANGEAVNSQLVANKDTLINIGQMLPVFECSKSTISGKVKKEGGKGEVPEVTVETLSFASCNCEVLVVKDGTYYVSHFVTTFNGTPFGTGQELEIQCNTIFGKVKCAYLTNNTSLGELQGGNPAVIAINAELPLKAGSNALCREVGIWTGKYEVTKPKPLYVASS